MICKLCSPLNKDRNSYFISQFDSDVLDAHFWIYDFKEVQQLIYECKYQGNYNHFRHIAHNICALLKDVQDQFGNSFTITYVPTISEHLRKRGFDHCKIMAQIYARKSCIPQRNCLIAKHQFSQVGGNRNHRFSNPEFVPKRELSGENLILIDDVASTRSTLFSASKALKSVGARHVFALTLGYKNLSKNKSVLLRM